VGRIKPGSAYARRFPEQQAVDGARIPRLADLFALVARSGDTAVRFNIETKLSPLAPGETASPEEFASALVGAVRSAGLVERTTIQSFDWRTLHIVQRLAPEISTVCLTAEQEFMDNVKSSARASPWTSGLHVSGFQNSIPRLVKAAGAAVWSPYYREVTAEKVKEAQALGLTVVVWTVNEPAEMQRMIELGVNGIISDYPDRLRRVAGDAGIALPRPSAVSP
jgi:glycerophosphoryl diester phosphodiesterase